MSPRILTAREQHEMLSPWRTAALTQDLVDNLHDQFHDWYHRNKDTHQLEDGGQYGPLRSWKNIEKFFQHNYPASHRGFSMGREQAGYYLDTRTKNQDFPPGQRKKYPTGPKMVEKYGYDPKEIAAAMLLLHNRSHPFRFMDGGEDWKRLENVGKNRQRLQDVYDRQQDIQGEMPQQDVDTLADIADKRSRMQQARRDPNRPMGININDTHQDYTGQILRGEKTIETRNTPSLHPYIGRRIAIYRTDRRRRNGQKTPALVVGHATVGEPVFYPDTASFDADYHRHLVGPDSPEHISSPKNKTGTKYGYPMLDPVALDKPMLVLSRGIVARGAEETDFAPYDGPWPLHTAMQLQHPEDLTVKWHPGEDGQFLAQEVRAQNGPRILHDTLHFADADNPEHYLYVARDKQGTIHGVVAGYDDGVDMDIHDAYTGLKAPQGTGGAMIRTVAQDALEGGRTLNVKHVLDHSRRYWQELGADIPEGEIDGTFSPAAHQALVDGVTSPAPFTKVYDDAGKLMEPMDSQRPQIERADRLPGSIIR